MVILSVVEGLNQGQKTYIVARVFFMVRGDTNHGNRLFAKELKTDEKH